MVDFEIVREWLTKAEEDFEFARVNFEEEKNFFAQICFHFQQAAEKFLKAYIVAHELDFRKIHELPLLLRTCQAGDPSFDFLREDCEFLSTFYVDTRYPVHWPTQFTRGETQKAFQSAAQIRRMIREKLCWP